MRDPFSIRTTDHRIECYREINLVGLVEAKNAVEALAREIKSSSTGGQNDRN